MIEARLLTNLNQTTKGNGDIVNVLHKSIQNDVARSDGPDDGERRAERLEKYEESELDSSP